MLPYPHGPAPDWHRDSLCSRADDPTRWDLGEGSTSSADRDMRAAELCAGCPVIEQCAAQALAEQPIGVIMAGMAMPSYRPWKPGKHAGLTAALEAIAAGWPAGPSAAATWTATRAIPAILAMYGVPGCECPGAKPRGSRGAQGAPTAPGSGAAA